MSKDKEVWRENMNRFIKATVLASLATSLLFGIFFIVAFFVMVITTIVFGGPLFLILKKKKKLSWWHSTLSGFCIAFTLVLIGGFFSPYSPYPPGILEKFDVMIIVAGTVCAYLFWWLGVFRNPQYPFVKVTFPVSSLLIVPILGFLFLLMSNLGNESGIRVHSISKQTQNSTSKPLPECSVMVNLSNGQTVEAEIRNCKLEMLENADKKCFYLTRVLSLPRFKIIYDLVGLGTSNGKIRC